MEWKREVPEEARRYFELGYRAQVEQRLDEAVEWYKKSIEACPTPEAHTFLGWVYSFQRRWDEAIAECETAIRIDADFGNPYNDIGAYLIELGRLDEAVEWLERAKRAPRYEPRHFPYMNLSRIYVMQHKIARAAAELREALGLVPDDADTRRRLARELHRLLGMLN